MAGSRYEHCNFALLYELVDACVMESYFREHMAERDLLFHDIVAPRLAADGPDLLAIIKQEDKV